MLPSPQPIEVTHGFTTRSRLHADRTAGRYRDHLGPDRAAAAGRAGGPRRRPARQCINNLKQLGLGMHNHHDTQGTFPFGAFNSPAQPWTFPILPYLEQTGMSNALNVNATFYDAKNSTVTSTTIGVFLCPSDPGAGSNMTVSGQPTRKKGNYVVNWGNSHYDQGNPNPFAGPLGSVAPQRGMFRVNTKTVPPTACGTSPTGPAAR